VIPLIPTPFVHCRGDYSEGPEKAQIRDSFVLRRAYLMKAEARFADDARRALDGKAGAL